MDKIKKTHGFSNEKMIVLPRYLLDSLKSHPLVEDLHITDIGHFPNAKNHYRERLEGSEKHI